MSAQQAAKQQPTADQVASDTKLEFDRKKDLTHIKKIASWHSTAVLAALALFGTSQTWVLDSKLFIAHLVSLGIAVTAAIVIGSIIHEWGHFAAARLCGAISPVPSTPYQLYFMFDFDMEKNSTEQFLIMSWGGQIASYGLVVLLLILIPTNSLAGAALISSTFGLAINTSVFELPVIWRARYSNAPAQELTTQLKTVGLRQTPGLIVGALTLAVLISF